MTTEPTEKHREEAREIVERSVPTPSCADCGAVGTVFITEPSVQWFRIVHKEGCHWAVAFAPRGVHEVCITVPNTAQRLIAQWREANDWPGLVWSSQNLSDEPRWLAAWKDLEQRINATLSSRDAEIREVLEGLKAYRSDCWCSPDGYLHSKACLAARVLWDKVQPPSVI